MSKQGANVGLPDGWTSTPIDAVFDSWGGLTPSKAESAFWGGEIPWASSRDIKGPRLATTKHCVTEEALAKTRLRTCPKGAVVVVVRSGVLAHTLPVAIATRPVVINQDLKAFDSGEDDLNAWLAAWLRLEAPEILASNRRDGTTVQSVRYSLLKKRVLPVPPLLEQRRIIERLEEIEDRRVSVDTHLRTARVALERLRSAVLSAACSGRLTKDWRESYPGVTSDSLHAEMINARRNGRARRATTTKEHGLASEAQLELLPSSWSLVRLGDVLDVGTGATPLRKNPAFYDGGTIPWVTSGAVNAGTITSPTELITPLALEETNVKLFPAGTLLVAMYGEGQTRGRVAELGIEAGSNQAVAALLFTETAERIRPFLRLFFEDSYLRMRALSAGGVQPNLSLGVIKDTLLPLPPYEEQIEIVRRATLALETADRLTDQIRKVESGVNRTLASVLAKAFRGDLVPTEAALASHVGRGFESGSELLARVVGGKSQR